MKEYEYKINPKERDVEYVMDDFEIVKMEIEEILNKIEDTNE